jgi:carbon storage regulator CsrA
VIPAGLRSRQGGHHLKAEPAALRQHASRSGCVVVTQPDINKRQRCKGSAKMLVITRRNLERVRIGNATVTVLISANGRVKLGIEAPRDVFVHRLGPASAVLELEPEIALQSFCEPSELEAATA